MLLALSSSPSSSSSSSPYHHTDNMTPSMIPVVDFAPFVRDEGVTTGKDATPQQLRTASAIDAAFRTVGFVVLSNVSLPTTTVAASYDAALSLFKLPPSHKLDQLPRFASPPNFGYHPPRTQAPNIARAPDIKEVFSTFHPDRVKQHFAECPPAFESACRELWAYMDSLTRRFAIACALALKLPLDFFVRLLATFREISIAYNYYPSIPFESAKTASHTTTAAIRVGEHTDWGLFTILVNNSPGLQAKPMPSSVYDPKASAPWIDVPVPPADSVIVNTGALLSRLTNDEWKAVAHRVIVENERDSAERMSIACFVHPDREQIVSVHPRFVPDGVTPRYPDIKACDFLAAKLKEARERWVSAESS